MATLSIVKDYVSRHVRLFVAATLVFSSVAPLLLTGSAGAYALLGVREIRMSTSEAEAEGASYRVEFDVSTAGNLGGIVVSFCENSPIIRDPSCVYPAGFEINDSFDNADEGDHNLSGWSSSVGSHADSGTDNNTFFLTNATPITVTADDTIAFTLDNVDSPTATGTFYARIMTYASDAHANGYTLADPDDGGPIVDAGGIALSTADLITIEAKVQERIIFCIYVSLTPAGDETDCNSVDDPIILGDSNGVLSSIDPSINKEARYNITTNASAGVTVRMKGDTLRSGSFFIDPIGDTQAASDEGNEQFGFCTYTALVSTDLAGLNPVAPYNHADCDQTDNGQDENNDGAAEFAFDDNTTNGTMSTYGQPISEKDAGDWSTGVLVFLGNISNTTEPGIYTTTLDFIATGRY